MVWTEWPVFILKVDIISADSLVTGSQMRPIRSPYTYNIHQKQRGIVLSELDPAFL